MPWLFSCPASAAVCALRYAKAPSMRPGCAGCRVLVLGRQLTSAAGPIAAVASGHRADKVRATRSDRQCQSRKTDFACSAASSADAVVHALAALATLLRLVIGDAANEAVLGAAETEPAVADASCLLATICERRDCVNVGGLPGAEAPFGASDAPPDRMRVERTTSWLHATATQLSRMLPPLFSVLRRHPRSSVRVASAHAADEMLCHCWRTLPACSSAALDCLLCLAHDQWPQVADAACSGLQRRALAIADGDGMSKAWLDALLVRQVIAFDAACTSEADATVAARLLAGAAGISGPARTADAIASPSRRSKLCRRLTMAFAMSGHAVQHHVPAFVANEPMQLLAAPAAVPDSGMQLPRRHARYSLLTSEEVSHMRLLYLTSGVDIFRAQSYAAVANVARLVGRAAVMTSTSALVAFVGAVPLRWRGSPLY